MIACLLGIQLCGFQFSGSQLHAANMPGKPTGNERIFLHHQGAVSLFAADKLKEAVEASVDGDTLFLTNGNYGFQTMSNGKEIYYGAKPITISKSVCIVGEGEDTYIGALAIDITDARKECHLYGIKSNLAIGQSLAKLDIQKSYVLLSINASIDDTQLKSSKLNLSINGWSTELKAFRAENCLINSCNFGIVDSDNLHISMNHCNIYELGGSGDDGDEYMNSFKGDISNSIIDHLKEVEGETRYFDPAVTLTNVLIRKTSEAYNPFKICKQTGSFALLSNDEILDTTGACRWTTETLTSKGCIGNDNTVMGALGGTTPYSLTLEAPQLQNPVLDINSSNHKLMFNLDIK